MEQWRSRAVAVRMTIAVYGRTEAGVEVHRISLGGSALRVDILTFGAVIERLEAPDRSGQWASVVLGLTSLDGYVHRSPHFGAVPGRFANRIAGGRFVLDGVEYRLACNDGPNALHGGPTGFGKRVWAIEDSSDRHVTLGRFSADGEEGYPGTLHAKVAYTLDGADLRLDYWARTDQPTVLNLTNHSYFNLGGEGSGSVLDHVLKIEADAFLPVTTSSIPTGSSGLSPAPRSTSARRCRSAAASARRTSSFGAASATTTPGSYGPAPACAPPSACTTPRAAVCSKS